MTWKGCFCPVLLDDYLILFNHQLHQIAVVVDMVLTSNTGGKSGGDFAISPPIWKMEGWLSQMGPHVWTVSILLCQIHPKTPDKSH